MALGDSYISGEGGRWQGNAAPWNLLGDRYGTDRAAHHCLGGTCLHQPTRIYGTSYANGCDRSDVSEVNSSNLQGYRLFNLACSGAETVNVKSAAQGGRPFKGERPQVDQLKDLLAHNKVDVIVLSIGGNDLKFSPVLSSCAIRFVTGARGCSRGATKTQFDADVANLGPKLDSVLQSIRGVMTEANGVDYPYHVVVQSYPVPVPASNRYRYLENGLTRFRTGGCPLYNADSNWARNAVVPQVAQKQREAAQRAGAVYLDLQDAFAGHELCSMDDRQALPTESRRHPIGADEAEWIRFVTLFTQGIKQESFHPNAFGQMALGACLGKLVALDYTSTAYTCVGAAGQRPDEVTVQAD